MNTDRLKNQCNVNNISVRIRWHINWFCRNFKERILTRISEQALRLVSGQGLENIQISSGKGKGGQSRLREPGKNIQAGLCIILCGPMWVCVCVCVCVAGLGKQNKSYWFRHQSAIKWWWLLYYHAPPFLPLPSSPSNSWCHLLNPSPLLLGLKMLWGPLV